MSQDTTTAQDFALSRLAAGSIAGDVLENGDPPKPVQVGVLEVLPVSAGLSATVAADGTYHLADVPSGLQTVRLRAPGYATLTQDCRRERRHDAGLRPGAHHGLCAQRQR